MHSYRDKNGIWFASTSIYGIGSGTTQEAAEKEALEMFKEQFWKEISGGIDSVITEESL